MFRTTLAEPYPQLLGLGWGAVIQENVRLRSSAKALSEPTPMAKAGGTHWHINKEHLEGDLQRDLQGFAVCSSPGRATDRYETRQHPDENTKDGSMPWHESYQLSGKVPDVRTPVVEASLGAPKGLTPLEHCYWVLQQPSPLAKPGVQLSPDTTKSIQFESTKTCAQIDEYGGHIARQLIHIASSLEEEQRQWANSSPLDLKPVTKQMRGPFIK